ncbi:MAG: hypothetical protein ACE5RC_06190, partial [Nitrosopumilus sp.]
VLYYLSMPIFCIHVYKRWAYSNSITPYICVHKIFLSEIDGDYFLKVPSSIVKLYFLKNEQAFELDVKESENDSQLVFLTYASKTSV